MYLKHVEMVGFKSFADKTKLELEPGMTAIVGPNGCGKSNVSDALRWVLGEQSAKALRGAKMEDCIFNGTQNRKPLGMAEVNITFTDCEGTLNTEYHEVTISRRVFRSGEGQYFLNRTPCRLKDIQRLFMDTGVGTASYSFMAQGRIDQILSARPEDRRAIFEEASGITKYKTDKREALRKLEHTEANLIRLADVIREVKRQIGSLQRQAGKARRYKSVKQELRGLDIFSTKRRLAALHTEITQLETSVEAISTDLQRAHADVKELQGRNASLHEAMLETERRIATASEAAMEARSKLDRTHDRIRMHTQRIEEYREWSERDTREAKAVEVQLEEQQTVVSALRDDVKTGTVTRDQLQSGLQTLTERHSEHRNQIEAVRNEIQAHRDRSVELDGGSARLQNQLVDLENRERASMVQRERLAAEKSQLAHGVESHAERLKHLDDELDTLRQDATGIEERLLQIEQQEGEQQQLLQETQQRRAALLSEAATRQTRIEMLTDAETVQGDFPSGAQWLLDNTDPLENGTSPVVGPLATLVDCDDDYERALEVALRSSIDALVITSPDHLRQLIRLLSQKQHGAARLCAPLPGDIPSPITFSGTRLFEYCRPNAGMESLFARLLANVFVVPTVDDIPDIVPPGATIVTKDGAACTGDGCAEFWMPSAGETNPLARKHSVDVEERACASIRTEITQCEETISGIKEQLVALASSRESLRRSRDEAQRAVAHKEGEQQLVTRDAEGAHKRLETVTYEFDQLSERGESWDREKADIVDRQASIRNEREDIIQAISDQNRRLQTLESDFSELQSELTEKRIAAANAAQRVEHAESQLKGAESRIHQLEAALQGRTAGIDSYRAGITKLEQEVADSSAAVTTLADDAKRHNDRAEELRAGRTEVAAQLKKQEEELATKREALEAEMNRKSELEVQLTELRMRRQNTTDRITGDYNLTLEQIIDEHDPDFDDGPPSIDDAETRVAELRAKMEAMGPVNLVAIEEYQEHEERYTFLTQQEQDLINAKQQLTEMIQKINKTTSELFRNTFDATNENFQNMFTRLFDGGAAKLVLVDEDDILESGIEIIARPPGKRLQSISLLSGGERTLTAVALLFAIYMIKPSPFCLLDELDAPLDDSNIGRFIGVLKEFLQQSQFMVITHNRQTIAAANVIYGVTMPERGVSKLVSMRFKDTTGGVVTIDENEAENADGADTDDA